jgi:Zn-dependent peptidase ImmA (M78 family)
MKRRTSKQQHTTWQLTQAYMQHIEEQAICLRQRAGIGSLDPLDPRLLADKLELQFVQLNAIAGLRPEVYQSIIAMDAREWSGMGKALPNGELLIALNPNMTIERETVTIMEEVAHAHYGHRPVELLTFSAGLVRRRYDADAEREAYWTAKAVLLPAAAVGQAVYRGRSAEEIAVRYGTSVELAEMRIKTLRLWPHYKPESLSFERTC